MLRRSRTKDHAPGEWEFGSGCLQMTASIRLDAAHREVREETGLEVDIIEPVGTFHFYRGAQREEAVGITFWCRYRAGELASSGEHDQALWVSPTEAKKLVSFPGGAEAIDRVARNIGR